MYKFSSLVCRYVFEIFDPDNNGYIEQPDVEAMYRMLYDTEAHDTKHITLIKFDDDNRITKDKFIKHMKSKKFIIKPALEYQHRMRRQLGGIIMWEGLAGYRKRHFSVFDSKVPCVSRGAKPWRTSLIPLSFSCVVCIAVYDPRRGIQGHTGLSGECSSCRGHFTVSILAPSPLHSCTQDPNEPVIPPDAEEILKQEKAKISDAIVDAKQVICRQSSSALLFAVHLTDADMCGT